MQLEYRRTDENGLSLLEIVIAVAVIAIFAVIGFLAFQNFTDNARQQAVERTANDVFTLAMASEEMPGSSSSNSGGIGTLAEIEQQHNDSTEYITVTIEKDGKDLTVTASGWDGRYTATRSTNPDQDGKIITPGDDTDSFTGDINDYSDGTFIFETSVSNSNLIVSGLSDNFSITYNDEKRTLDDLGLSSDGGVIPLPHSGTYTVSGGFKKLGVDAMKLIEQFSNGEITFEEYLEIAQNVMNTPFLAHDSKITVWDNTGTVDLSGAFMFSNIESVVSPPTTVENMSNLFNQSTFNDDLSDWNTQNVKNMKSMFGGATEFNQDISDWDVSNVQDMSEMFLQSAAFNNGGKPLDWDDTGEVTDMSNMFNDASSFNQSISSWDTGNVVDMSNMFSNASSFNQPIGNWDTGKVQDMSEMFEGAITFDQDLSGWNLRSIETLEKMFVYAHAYNNGGKSLEWDTIGELSPNGVTMKNILGTAVYSSKHGFFTSSFDQDVSSWNMENVKDLSGAFANNKAFNNGGKPLTWKNIGENVSDGVTMEEMFMRSNFNQEIGDLDVSNVVDMTRMFREADSFNQDISAWDVANVENMTEMFYTNFSSPKFKQDLSSWKVPKISEYPSNFFGNNAYLRDDTSKHPQWGVS